MEMMVRAPNLEELGAGLNLYQNGIEAFGVGSERSLDKSTSTTFMTAEIGIMVKLPDDVPEIRVGYEFTRFGRLNLTLPGDNSLTITPGNHHMVKVSLFHFFRKK